MPVEDAFNEGRVDLAIDERGGVEDFLMDRDGRLDSFHHKLAQGPAGAGDRPRWPASRARWS